MGAARRSYCAGAERYRPDESFRRIFQTVAFHTYVCLLRCELHAAEFLGEAYSAGRGLCDLVRRRHHFDRGGRALLFRRAVEIEFFGLDRIYSDRNRRAEVERILIQ